MHDRALSVKTDQETVNWYTIENIDRIDTPCLVLYRDRILFNIQQAVKLINNIDNLRPHVKTNKIAEVCRMMMDAGIKKFKCATIAEAEMLAMINAPDVLLAYQPAGPKAERLNRLALHYPDTTFSCIVDNIEIAKQLSSIYSKSGINLKIFIDVNSGMNRTGIHPSEVNGLADKIQGLGAITIEGIHVYDGHLTDTDAGVRKRNSDLAFIELKKLIGQLEDKLKKKLVIVAGGSATFPAHAERNVECSPGTFVFWDWGYKHRYPEEPFEYAAIVVSRIISVVNETTITTDLGHKAVASENPQPRVYFMNAPGSVSVAHSEEHMVLSVSDSSKYKPGDVLYGIPVHICPTVALYEKAIVVENHQATTVWKVAARDRMINF